MVWETIIPAAAALIGGIISNRGSAKSQETANTANVALTQENRDWMERLSNTSYQRAVKDMQAAGLNPMLAYSQGGASTPSSAAPTVAPVPRLGQAVGEGLAKATSSAMQGVQLVSGFQNIEQSKAQTANLYAQVEKTKSETMEQSVNNAKLLAEIRKLQSSKELDVNTADKIREEILGSIYHSQSAKANFEEMSKGGFAADVRRRKAEASLAELDIPKSKAEAGMYNRTGGDVIPYIGPIMDMIRGVSSARRGFRGGGSSFYHDPIPGRRE